MLYPLVHTFSYRCVDLDVGSRISGSIEEAYHVIRYCPAVNRPAPVLTLTHSYAAQSSQLSH